MEKNVINKKGMTLVELLVVIGIMAVILGVAVGPFLNWYRRGKLEDRANSLLGTIQWAQSKAMKSGETDIINGKIVKQKIYVGINELTKSYRVVQWIDSNSDNVKDTGEFTKIQEGFLTNDEIKFGYVATVNKTACGNGTPTSTANIQIEDCPTVGTFLTSDYKCARFDGKGFLSESMKNAAIYLTNDVYSYAIALNPAGIISLCFWDGNSWKFIR